MRVFAIKDEEQTATNVLGYLLYYENAKAFYIELPEDIDTWDAPLLLSSFVKRGEYSVNAYWSRMWVQQRIVPSDRQNLGQILKANGLAEYDEFSLLTLGMGRCAQDSYYLEEEKSIPDMLTARWVTKVDDVIPLSDGELLVFFRDGRVKKCDMNKILSDDLSFHSIVSNRSLFQNVSVQPDGYGVYWNERLALSDKILYASGQDVPLSLDDFKAFVTLRVVNSAEAQNLLDCTRQYINELVKKNMLHPIRKDARNMLFLKSEITQRMNR